jgi:NAD(P)-dependent dehydrogenase (short-subunit alcohol dehydrogenase family)
MDDLFGYDGKRALVVGCFSGMGAATANIVASLGAEVYGVDYKEPDYDLAGFQSCDLRDEAQIDAMLASLEGPFHAVFYCAGVAHTHPPLDVMKVNFAALRRVVEGVESLIPRGGAIASISSTGGLGFMQRMEPIKELLATEGFGGAIDWCAQHADVVREAYSFSKEALVVYTMARSLELVDTGVRVNCISPGPTDTPLTPEFEQLVGGADILRSLEGPMKRKATPEEMGWPMAFLNSDAASWVNGFNLVVDGARLAGRTLGEAST